jgi:hypothetical protein
MKRLSGITLAVFLFLGCGESSTSSNMVFQKKPVSPSIRLEGLNFKECERIKIAYNGLIPSPNMKGYWIGLADAGAPSNKDLKRFKYLARNTLKGEIELATHGLKPKTQYEIRLYDDWEANKNWNILDSKTITIRKDSTCNQATLKIANSRSWRRDGYVRIDYSGFYSSMSNWISIAEEGSLVYEFVAFSWAKSTPEAGQVVIPTTSLEKGKEYVVRAYMDWDDKVNYLPGNEIKLK